MGSSPSADVYYGYDLGDLTGEDFEDLRPQWWQDDEEWEEALARKLGWAEVPYPDFGEEYNSRYRAAEWDERQRMDQERYETPEYEAWSDSRDEMRRLLSQVQVEIDRYGYYDEPTYALRVKASVQGVGDWGSVELEPLVVQSIWDTQLQHFVELLELRMLDGLKPGWHLNCSYG